MEERIRRIDCTNSCKILERHDDNEAGQAEIKIRSGILSSLNLYVIFLTHTLYIVIATRYLSSFPIPAAYKERKAHEH
jgi:hypothetical protein